MLLVCHIYRRDAIRLNVSIRCIFVRTTSLAPTNAEIIRISSFKSLGMNVILGGNLEKNRLLLEAAAVLYFTSHWNILYCISRAVYWEKRG